MASDSADAHFDAIGEAEPLAESIMGLVSGYSPAAIALAAALVVTRVERMSADISKEEDTRGKLVEYAKDCLDIISRHDVGGLSPMHAP